MKGTESRWPVRAHCSPASGPTCRSQNSPRAARAGASTGSSLPAGATTSRSTAALADDGYARGRRELLERHGLGVWAIGAHLVGQAVCDPIDARHRAILPPEVWGDGEPEGVRRARRRAHEGHRARRGAARRDAGERLHRLVDLASDLLLPAERLRRRSSAATQDFAERWGPILDVFDARGRAVRARGSSRPRSPTTSSPRARRSTRSETARLRHQPRPEPPRATRSSTRPRSRSSSATASTTCT